MSLISVTRISLFFIGLFAASGVALADWMPSPPTDGRTHCGDEDSKNAIIRDYARLHGEVEEGTNWTIQCECAPNPNHWIKVGLANRAAKPHGIAEDKLFCDTYKDADHGKKRGNVRPRDLNWEVLRAKAWPGGPAVELECKGTSHNSEGKEVIKFGGAGMTLIVTCHGNPGVHD